MGCTAGRSAVPPHFACACWKRECSIWLLKKIVENRCCGLQIVQLECPRLIHPLMLSNCGVQKRCNLLLVSITASASKQEMERATLGTQHAGVGFAACGWWNLFCKMGFLDCKWRILNFSTNNIGGCDIITTEIQYTTPNGGQYRPGRADIDYTEIQYTTPRGVVYWILGIIISHLPCKIHRSGLTK